MVTAKFRNKLCVFVLCIYLSISGIRTAMNVDIGAASFSLIAQPAAEKADQVQLPVKYWMYLGLLKIRLGAVLSLF